MDVLRRLRCCPTPTRRLPATPITNECTLQAPASGEVSRSRERGVRGPVGDHPSPGRGARRRDPGPGVHGAVRDRGADPRARQGRRLGDTAAAKQLAAEIAALPDDAARATASAFAVYFDLVNLAEEVHRILALRARERSRIRRRSASRSARRSAGLAARGTSAAADGGAAGALRVELVLTAHPTEAKRRTVLSKLQRIAEALRRLVDPELLPREREALAKSCGPRSSSYGSPTGRARRGRP